MNKDQGVTRQHDPVFTDLFIDGGNRSTEHQSAIFDPARPDVLVGYAAAANEFDTDSAIQAARHAFPSWSKLSQTDRARILAEAIEHEAAVTEHDVSLLTLETGKILRESAIDFAVFRTRWLLALTYQAEVDRTQRLSLQDENDTRTQIQYQALGVVTIIVPFNWPLAIVAASLPQALLAGNTVVVKPPLTAPLATTSFLSRVAKQLPPGVINIVTGENHQVSGLIANVDVAKVCFTGSVSGGREIMRLASKSLTRLTLELGGNDPAVILRDALLDETQLDRLFHSIFDTSGQICMNAKRVFVHAERFDDVVAGLEERLKKIQLGHGLNSRTTHGPVHTFEQARFAAELLTEAQSMGATVKQYGDLPLEPSIASGHFVRPALVLEPPLSARIVTQEPFSPVIPLNRFALEEDALEMANDSWAGLGASIWTSDPSAAHRLAGRLRVGYVWINDHGAPRLDLRAPFGGMKQSGFGREQGIEGMRAFMDTRVVAVSGGDDSWT